MAKFEALEHISESDFRYEVCLYRTIFTTPSIECRLTDLRPCSEYHIRIHALADAHQLRGGMYLHPSVSIAMGLTPSPPLLRI